LIQKGKTYCLLGSSGVGKSTLSNNLSGSAQMKTGEISSSVNKGKHVTSHRKLILLENEGILIDNPGIREVGITDSGGGLEMTFDEIIQLASSCRFNDCTQINEAGCAILEALDNESLDEPAYDNYQKMEKEKSHFESSLVERRNKDKNLGKLIKSIKKDRNQNKY
jgi:ribosome biogenesis GTPase